MNICSVILNHLEPSPWNHQLRQFSEEQFDSLKFFVRKYPKVREFLFLEWLTLILLAFKALISIVYGWLKDGRNNVYLFLANLTGTRSYNVVCVII